MVQQVIVALLVIASALWLLWNVILPARAKRAIAGNSSAAEPRGGCHGCALSKGGCGNETNDRHCP